MLGPRGPVWTLDCGGLRRNLGLGLAAAMEGEHRGGRRVKGGVIGSKSDAAALRRCAQRGAAAAARRGQAVQLARATQGPCSAATLKDKKAIQKEVARAMKQGTGLVQAALEHLDTAEHSWDRFVELGGHVIDGYPSEVQVVTYCRHVHVADVSRAAAHVPCAARQASEGCAEKRGA